MTEKVILGLSLVNEHNNSDHTAGHSKNLLLHVVERCRTNTLLKRVGLILQWDNFVVFKTFLEALQPLY